MIQSCDSGSLPFEKDFTEFKKGANNYGSNKNEIQQDFFEKIVVASFIDKIKTGIDVPNYPQFRDMNEMFFSMISGIEKIENGYLETTIPFLKTSGQIPEVFVIRENSKNIYEKI